MPAREVELLERYWLEEPWGPWRDNVHTAIIARETLKANGFKAPKLDVFMLKSRSQREAEQQAAGEGVISMLKAISVRKKRTKSGSDYAPTKPTKPTKPVKKK